MQDCEAEDILVAGEEDAGQDHEAEQTVLAACTAAKSQHSAAALTAINSNCGSRILSSQRSDPATELLILN